VTHLLWDSFTHYDGFIAVYFYDFFFTKIEGISLFNIFQHISSLIGALFVGIYIFRMKKVITPQYLAQRKYLYWGLVFLLGCFVFAIRAHYGFERMEEIIVTLIGSIVWAILIGSILIKKHLVV
jgi:hypothetical protein